MKILLVLAALLVNITNGEPHFTRTISSPLGQEAYEVALDKIGITIFNSTILVHKVYHRNGTVYYMSGPSATSFNNPTIFNIKYGTTTTIQQYDKNGRGRYLSINPYYSELAWDDGTPQAFYMVPTSNNRFHLHFTAFSGFAFVTPLSFPPFNFYIEGRYPDEDLAEFEFIPIDINLSSVYNGSSRIGILEPTQLIHNMTSIPDKQLAYSEVLQQMKTSGHINGSEILTLASYIYEDTGANNSELFKQLPLVVQLIASQGSISLL